MKVITALEPSGNILLQIVDDAEKLVMVSSFTSDGARKIGGELNKLADMSDMLAEKQS